MIPSIFEDVHFLRSSNSPPKYSASLILKHAFYQLNISDMKCIFKLIRKHYDSLIGNIFVLICINVLYLTIDDILHLMKRDVHALEKLLYVCI